MSDPELSVVIATLNEEDSIGSLIEALREHITVSSEIIVVDDDSRDRTREIVEGFCDPAIKVIRRTTTTGLASAILRGVIETRGQIIAWMDADAWMMPPRIPEMIALLDRFDLVVASRYVEGGRDARSGARVWASRAVNLMAQLILGDYLHDHTSNFVVMRRTVFDHVVPMPYGFGEFFMELVYRAHRCDLGIAEVPYQLEERQGGSSKAIPNPFRFAWLGLQYGARILFIRLRGRG
jgi:dolichol-phosphate mannosyltransferase